MCLITNKKEVSIAKRDKTVVKWLRKSLFNNPGFWSGPVFHYAVFPFNEIVTAKDYSSKEIDHLQICEDCCIYEGFHSYRIHSLLKIIKCYYKICVIPKGSEYCYGKEGDVVSKEIIVFSNYKEYFRYKWKKLREKIF